jgi:hypothetical protein
MTTTRPSPNGIATRQGCATGEFGILVRGGTMTIFCKVNSESDGDADLVVQTINASRQGEPVWPRDDPD